MTTPSNPRVVYLCLETLQPGQAAATHVRAIIQHLGLPTTLFAIETRADEPHRTLPRKAADYFGLTIRAARALRRADVAYVRAHPAALFFSLAARAMRKPVLHEVNGRAEDIGVSHGLAKPLLRLLTWAQAAQYRSAAALIAVTPGLAVWLRGLAGQRMRIEVVPNGADADLFRPDATGGPPIEGAYALFFGGLVAWHGVRTMIEALGHPAWPPHVRLVVAGHGPMLGAVVASAERDPRILALGYVEKDELASLASRALATLCPIEHHGGRNEGGVAPLKLFEGMAAGRPVVASDLPFQGDLVRKHDCGIVFKPGDAGELAEAVATLAAQPDQADMMGARGRRAVEQDYDWRLRARDTAAIVRACATRALERTR